MDLIFRQKLINLVEQVLHVPGNYRGGTLEMAIVLDCSLPADEAKEKAAGTARILKSHSEVFRNVRVNGVSWINDERILQERTALPSLMMGRGFTEYENNDTVKSIELMAQWLKLYQARSKLILMITGGDYRVGDREALQGAMYPFLARKWLLIQKSEVFPCSRLICESVKREN